MNSDKGFKWQLISIAIYFFYFRKKEMFSVRREAEGTILYLLGTKRRQPAAFYDNFKKKKKSKIFILLRQDLEFCDWSASTECMTSDSEQ